MNTASSPSLVTLCATSNLLDMLRHVIITLLFFIPTYLFSQGNINIDSVLKPFDKTYRKNLKLLKNQNDSSVFLTGYNKRTHEVLGVQILMNRSYFDGMLPSGQYSLHYYPNEIVLIRATADHSDGKHVGHARYLFQHGILVSKEQDKYIQRDYSSLFANSQLYKQVASEYLSQKFNN
jgi:hypothetical protein